MPNQRWQPVYRCGPGKVDLYLGCGDDGSAKEKQANYEAALNLEKAIAIVREYDAVFCEFTSKQDVFPESLR
jgi:hypothetical protein